MSKEIPIDRKVVAEILLNQPFDARRASIRDMNQMATAIADRTGIPFVHLEFGIPGFSTPALGIEAQVQALTQEKVSSRYAPSAGIPDLKQEASRFVQLFMDLHVPPDCCIPTVGAMQGSFLALALATRMRDDRDTVLFLDPGFPSNRAQIRFFGLKAASLDFYDSRGDKLAHAVDAMAREHRLAAVLWSSPNNPTWISLKDNELEALGEVCLEHGILAIEDLAYFGMDTRRDYLQPGEPPFQPTILRHSPLAVTLFSGSKLFSFAGERGAFLVVHPDLFASRISELERWCGTTDVGRAIVHGLLYPIMSCAPHSPQRALATLLRAANSGDRSILDARDHYSRRAAEMKRIFLENGFQLVYDNDLGEPLADGFFFTVSHPDFPSGGDLALELLHYGISAITLETAGSVRKEGLRICTSLADAESRQRLAQRLRLFRPRSAHIA